MVYRNARGLDHARSVVPAAGKSARPASTETSVRDERMRLLACPACGGTRHRFLYVKNNCDIVRCEDCGLGRAQTNSFDPNSYYTRE